jgi:hypothetical protein
MVICSTVPAETTLLGERVTAEIENPLATFAASEAKAQVVAQTKIGFIGATGDLFCRNPT